MSAINGSDRTIPSIVDPNAPVTIPAWLFQQMLNTYRPYTPPPIVDPTPSPFPDGPGVIGEWHRRPPFDPDRPMGGGVPSPLSGWEPVGRAKKDETASPDILES